MKPLIISDTETIQREIARLLEYGLPLSFDIETTGFDPRKDRLVLVQLKAPGAKSVILDTRDIYEDKSGYQKRLLARLLRPIFRKNVTLWGHNLQFDMLWVRVHLGINAKAKLSDTMLRELVIQGMGYGEIEDGVSLKATGARYGVDVSKEERMWFPGLDKRLELWKNDTLLDSCTTEEDNGKRKELKLKHATELAALDEDNATLIRRLLAEGWSRPWYEPIPQAQLEYARQDVVAVIRIHKAQEPLIEEQGLGGVVDLESRVLPAVVSMKGYGVGVDRTVFGNVLKEVHEKSEEYATQLHEALDVPILTAREATWKKQMEPYQQWVGQRDTYMAEVLSGWEKQAIEYYTNKKGNQSKRTKKGYDGPLWGEVKKEAMARFKERYPEPKHPAVLKSGVNLNSPTQIVTGLRGIGLLVGSADQKLLTPFIGDSDLIGRTVQTYLWYSDYKTVEKRWGNGWMDEHLSLEEYVDHTTGEVTGEWRWYVDWQQIGASTGRFSSGFQQVNKRGPGAGLRKAFVPRKGYKLVVADFSNIELRIAAALSGDAFLLAAFSSGLDLHTYTAEIMFNLTANEDYMKAKAEGAKHAKEWADTTDVVLNGHTLLNTHYRDISKTINFSVLYGAGVRNLAIQMRVEVRVARQLKQIHYDAFHVALDWIDTQGRKVFSESAKKAGRVFSVTRAGRRRWFTLPTLEVTKEMSGPAVREAQDKYKGKIQDIKRSLANAPVQGTSADITKLAMALWFENYECEAAHLVLTLHDELGLEVLDDPDVLADAKEGLTWCMYTAMATYIPEVAPGEVEPMISPYWKH